MCTRRVEYIYIYMYVYASSVLAFSLAHGYIYILQYIAIFVVREDLDPSSIVIGLLMKRYVQLHHI
jgi:hypothetical protein